MISGGNKTKTDKEDKKMADNEMHGAEDVGYQITVTNIKYGRELYGKFKERPEMVTLDVPESLLKVKGKDDEKFRDGVESFAYNTVTRKFGAEVSFCQVWLPLEPGFNTKNR